MVKKRATKAKRPRKASKVRSATARDTTERNKAEEIIRSLEAKFRAIYEGSNDAIMLLDEKGFFDCNARTLEMFRCNSKEEFTRLHPADLSPPFQPDGQDSLSAAQERIRTAYRQGHNRFEWTRRRRNGEDFQAEVLLSVFPFEEKTVLQAIVDDITERKQMEEGLQKSEELYRGLFQNTREAICINTPDGRYIDFNEAWLSLFGYSREEMLKLDAVDLYADPADRAKFKEKMEQEGFVKDFEVKFRRKDGTLLGCLNTSVAWRNKEGQILGYQGIIRDITVSKRAQEMLRMSEERFRKIFQYNPNALLITSLDGPIIDANDAWFRWSGFSREEAIGRSTIELGMLPDPKERDLITKELLEKRQLRNIELKRRTKTGEVRDILNTLELVELNGQTCLLNMHLDVTERKKLEKELKKHSEHLEELMEQRTRELHESEEKYKTLALTSPDAVIVTDLEGIITDVSNRTLELHGFSSTKELLGKNILNLIAPEDREKAMITLQRTMEPIIRDVEYALLRKDGTRFPAELNSAVIKDTEGKPKAFITTTREITERKRAEEMREQFLSHVTHELRTPLGPLKVHVEYALAGKLGPLTEKLKSSLKVMKMDTDRLIELTDQVLEIRRFQSGNFGLNLQPLDLQEIISQSMKEAQVAVDVKKQHLHVEVPDGPVLITGDPTRLSQVMTNLLSNASTFTPENGQITIKLEDKTEACKVTVSDTGIGIRKDDLSVVFQPFATIQKPTWMKGAGLGLSIAKGIVEAHGGKIWVESDGEGKGATFTFTLPKPKEND